MIADVLRLHYGYSEWATNRIFSAVEQMPTAAVDLPGHAGHGSIRDTLLHMIETQWGWFCWFDGSMSAEQAYGMTIDRSAVHAIPSIRQKWTEVHTQATSLIERLAETELSADWPLGMPGGPSTPVPLWKMMLHVANHGTQHRSEIAAMLTEHGCSPGYMDMLFYMLEQGAPAT